MRALALSLGEPKVGYFSKIHITVCYLCSYLLFSNLSCQISPTFPKPHSRALSFAAQTPIEEFTPTPAFPALQYLESVDEGGVAWRTGLRMGDFLIEVRPSYNSERHSAIKEHHFVAQFTFLGQWCKWIVAFSKWSVKGSLTAGRDKLCVHWNKVSISFSNIDHLHLITYTSVYRNKFIG